MSDGRLGDHQSNLETFDTVLFARSFEESTRVDRLRVDLSQYIVEELDEARREVVENLEQFAIILHSVADESERANHLCGRPDSELRKGVREDLLELFG